MIFKENKKEEILENFFESGFLVLEDIKSLKLITKEFNKILRKIDINEFEEKCDEIFKEDFQNYKDKEKIMEIFEKNL